MLDTLREMAEELTHQAEALGEDLESVKTLKALPAAEACVELDRLQARLVKLRAKVRAAGDGRKGK